MRAPFAANAVRNSLMLCSRTGSEQLMNILTDERSKFGRSLTETRLARNCNVKFGIQLKVHLYWVINDNIDPGRITQSVGDCITTGRWWTRGNMKHAINPMSWYSGSQRYMRSPNAN